MNKKNINILFNLIIFYLIFKVFFNNALFYNSIILSLKMFIYKVFPFLFIMMILNKMLISFNFPYYLNKIFKKKEIYIMIMSMLSGSPINAIILNDYLKNKQINEKSASITLMFTTFNNPLFLYNYFLSNFTKKDTFILMSIIYISNIIIYLIFKNKIVIDNKRNKFINYNKKNELFNNIYNSLESLIKIMGIIIFFKVITDLLFINESYFTSLLKGLIELTTGLNSLNNFSYSLLKKIIALTIISFASLSIHMQISIILSSYKINYKYFYLSRILLILINIILLCLQTLM